jgi:hypothetical protein
VNNKEAHVFDDPEYLTASQKRHFADTKFASLLPTTNTNHAYYCDATPITLFHPEYLKECINYNADAKYIVILRNPIDRAFSQYEMSKNKGAESRCASIAFLRDIVFYSNSYKTSGIWPFESPRREQNYLSRGQYVRQLDCLFTHTARKNVVVLWQHDLLTFHQNSLDRLFSFLGLPTKRIEKSTVFEGTKTVSTLDRWLATQVAKCFYLYKRETSARLNALLQSV